MIYQTCEKQAPGSTEIEPGVWVRQAYVGATLSIWERNGYDDSDFGVLVWDGEKPVRIETWSTRYPAPNWARVDVIDATPEVLAAYRAWCDEARRKEQRASRKAYASVLRTFRADVKAAAAKHGVDYVKLLRLRKGGAYTRRLGRIVRLLKGTQRSDFKRALQVQVVAWLRTPNGKYDCPLSPRQLQHCDEYGYRPGSRYSSWGAAPCPLKDDKHPRA